jgi:ribonuclease HII
VTVRHQATRFYFIPYSYSYSGRPTIFESERDWFVSVDQYDRLWIYHGHWDRAWGELRQMPSGGIIPFSPSVLLHGMSFTDAGHLADGSNVVTATGHWAGVPQQFLNRIPDRESAQWGNVPPVPESAPQFTKPQQAPESFASKDNQRMAHRKLIIGTDEAGYGPNLGPLVITATAWWVPADCSVTDLWQRLKSVIRREASRIDKRLYIADSKRVFSPGAGLSALETSVLAFLQMFDGKRPETIRQLGRLTSSQEFCNGYDSDPCHLSEHTPLPLKADPLQLDELADELHLVMKREDIELVGVESRIMFPVEFNLLCRRTGSKGSVLSEATLELIRHFLNTFPQRNSARVYCDKHGGRNRYDELIAEQFNDAFVFRIQESRARSRYRVADVEFCFRTKAEELLPVALSSMVAKYTREVLMSEFNVFWKTHLPELKPTQGYPVDAARFRDAIAPTAATLGIDESRFWRCR